MLVRVKGSRASRAGFAALDPACARRRNIYASDGQTDASGGSSGRQMCFPSVAAERDKDLKIDDTVNGMWSL